MSSPAQAAFPVGCRLAWSRGGAYTQTSDNYCGSLIEKLIFVEAASRRVSEYSVAGLGDIIPIGWAATPTHTPDAEATQTVTGFILVDADAGEDLRPLIDSDTITAPSAPPIAGSVVFTLNNTPYAQANSQGEAGTPSTITTFRHKATPHCAKITY